MFHHITHEIDVASPAQDTEVAIIVQQIEHHEREILALRKRLNRHLPAARIPDDILVEIFSHSFRLIRQSFWEWRAKVLSWAQPACPEELTHWPVVLVCQRWRGLVMDNPRLWSFITSYDKPGYAYNAMTRSAKAKLQLCLTKPSVYGDQDVFNALLEQLPRAHSLEYQFDATPWSWGNPQPHLGPIRSLSLVRASYDFSDRSDPLAKHLATAPLPHLETLYFKNVPSEVCTILPRPMLTFLEIDSTAGRSDCTRLETRMLIISLADLPFLEVLRLAFPSLPKSLCKIPDSQLPDMHHPHLRELKICTETDACLLLLLHLSFPLGTAVSISTSGVWAQYDGDLGNPFWFTQERVDSSLIDGIMQQLKTLKLDYWRPPYQLLLRDNSLYDAEAKHTTIQIRPQSGDALNIQISHRNVDQVVGHLPLQDVEAIEFENTSRSLPADPSNDHDPSEDVHHWSRKIPATSVTFSGSSEFLLSFLVSIARQRDQPGETNSQHGIALPHMESLTVRWIGKDCQGGPFNRFLGNFMGLLRLLKRRHEAGFPFEKFVWQYDKDAADFFSLENLRWEAFCACLAELGTEAAMECITINN